MVSCVCCGAGAMCHALRDSQGLHAYPACMLPLCSYLLHTWGSLSTTGIEPDSVPTARLPESEPEQCHTCSLWQVHAGRGRWRPRVVAGCHLVSPQTRLSFDYVTYGGAYAHVTDLICRRLERWSEQTHDAGSGTNDALMSMHAHQHDPFK